MNAQGGCPDAADTQLSLEALRRMEYVGKDPPRHLAPNFSAVAFATVLDAIGGRVPQRTECTRAVNANNMFIGTMDRRWEGSRARTPGRHSAFAQASLFPRRNSKRGGSRRNSPGHL